MEKVKTKKSINVFKIIIQGALFLSILGITFGHILENNSLTEIKAAVRESSPLYLFFAIIIMSLFFLGESINIVRGLRITGNEVSIAQGMKYAITGFFFSSITPSSSGGQPMQLYQMYKDRIPAGQGTLALLLEFISYQTVTVVLACIGLIVLWNRIVETMGEQWIFLFIGFLLNFVTMIGVYLLLFCPRVFDILRKWNFIERRLGSCITEYQNGALVIRQNSSKIFPFLFTTTIQMLAMYSVPYFVYASYGFHAYHWIDIILLQSVLYVSVSALPIPGAIGVSESGFIKLFRILFPVELLSGAMILSRGISFYLYLFVTGMICAVMIIFPYHNDRILNRQKNNPTSKLPGGLSILLTLNYLYVITCSGMVP